MDGSQLQDVALPFGLTLEILSVFNGCVLLAVGAEAVEEGLLGAVVGPVQGVVVAGVRARAAPLFAWTHHSHPAVRDSRSYIDDWVLRLGSEIGPPGEAILLEQSPHSQ